MPEPDETTWLKNSLLTMADLPTAPADPMPLVHRRIVRQRRKHAAIGAVTVAACAALIAATVVPAINAATGTAGGPAATTQPTTEPTTEPTPWESPGRSKTPVPPGSVGSEEFYKGLPVGSQVKGVGFEEFVAGKQGPGYVVTSGGALAVVSYRENGNGQPCLAEIHADGGIVQRYCLDRQLSDNQTQWEQSRSGNVLFVFAGTATHDIELVSKPGDQMGRAKVIRTKTSDGVRFYSPWLIDEGPRLGKVVAHRSATEADQGITPPSGKGHSSVLRVGGKGSEDFEPGKQGVGYVVDGFAGPGVAVAHRLDGIGQPCLTIAGLARTEPLCFQRWQPGERHQATIKKLSDGRTLVAGFAKLDVAKVDVLDAKGEAFMSIDPVATPTTQELAFFSYAFGDGERLPESTRVTK